MSTGFAPECGVSNRIERLSILSFPVTGSCSVEAGILDVLKKSGWNVLSRSWHSLASRPLLFTKARRNGQMRFALGLPSIRNVCDSRRRHEFKVR